MCVWEWERERELTVKALDQLILSVLVHHGWRTWWLDSEWNRKGIPTWFYFGSKIAIEYWSELTCLVFHEQKVLFFGFALWINRCYRWFCQWHISLLLPCVCFPLIQTSYLAYSLISTFFSWETDLVIGTCTSLGILQRQGSTRTCCFLFLFSIPFTSPSDLVLDSGP